MASIPDRLCVVFHIGMSDRERLMTKYLVFLATGTIEIEADLVRENHTYFSKVDGQQPTICFYRGRTPDRDKCVGEYVYKNISGYCEAECAKVLSLNS